MRRASHLALFLAALLSPGCLVLSLQPAYDNDSIVSDDALVGGWSNADDQTEATIERGEWRSYRIVYKDRFATRTFQGNLTKIGAAVLLDLTELRGVDPGPYLVPVHGVFRVEIAGDGPARALQLHKRALIRAALVHALVVRNGDVELVALDTLQS